MTEFGNPFTGQGSRGWQPKGYVVPVLVTIFCCLIGGIISIIYTAQANTAGAGGNIALAEKHAGTAKTWTIVSLCVGALGIVLWIGAIIIGVLAGPGQHS